MTACESHSSRATGATISEQVCREQILPSMLDGGGGLNYTKAPLCLSYLPPINFPFLWGGGGEESISPLAITFIYMAAVCWWAWIVTCGWPHGP